MFTEWGGPLKPGRDVIWMMNFVAYMKQRDLTDGFVFTLGPNSIDTGGLLLEVG